MTHGSRELSLDFRLPSVRRATSTSGCRGSTRRGRKASSSLTFTMTRAPSTTVFVAAPRNPVSTQLLVSSVKAKLPSPLRLFSLSDTSGISTGLVRISTDLMLSRLGNNCCYSNWFRRRERKLSPREKWQTTRIVQLINSQLVATAKNWCCCKTQFTLLRNREFSQFVRVIYSIYYTRVCKRASSRWRRARNYARSI